MLRKSTQVSYIRRMCIHIWCVQIQQSTWRGHRSNPRTYRMQQVTFPEHGPIPATSMRVDRHPPMSGMQLNGGIPKTSMAIPSRGDPGNAMTHTLLLDKECAHVRNFKYGEGTCSVSYGDQIAWLETGSFVLICHPKHGPRLGRDAASSSAAPIVSMAMWNALASKEISENFHHVYGGLLRECNQAGTGNHPCRRLWSVTTYMGGMVGGEASDAMFRSARCYPISKGDQVYMCEYFCTDTDTVRFFIFVHNATSKPEECHEDLEMLIKCVGMGSPDYRKAGFALASTFWSDLGKAFGQRIRKKFAQWLKGSLDEGDRTNFQQIGRIGTALWKSSSDACDEGAVARHHFSTECAHRGKVDLLLCST